MVIRKKKKRMPNQVTNNIQVNGNESSRVFFRKLSDRLNQKNNDKITQIASLLWQNTYKGTISWNYKHLKCRWAVVERAGQDCITILSGRTPAAGVQDRIFNTLKKIDKNVALINEYHDTDEKYIGTRILYREFESNEKVNQKDIETNKDDPNYQHILSDMKNATRYRAEGQLYEWKKIHEGDYDDDEI